MTPKALTNTIRLIGAIGLFFLVGALIHYYFQFGGELSNKQEIWGVFGDYVGGFVGTILAFLSLIALLLTISTQLNEVRETRKQMEAMKIAQERSTKISELNALIELQDRYSKFLHGWEKKYEENNQQGEGAVKAKNRIE